MEETVRSKTGLLIDPYFSASKIAWILENVQERAKRPTPASSRSAPSIAGSSGT